MRTATLVLVGYLLAILVSSVWRMLPAESAGTVVPDVVALTAAYLGLTARRYIAPAVAGAVVLGYLGDLISGAPPGLLSLSAGVMVALGDAIHRRILVRGFAMTIGFSVLIGAASALNLVVLRALYGIPLAEVGTEATRIAGVTLATGLFGPAVLWLYRRIDAAFARTHRERDAALEGLHT